MKLVLCATLAVVSCQIYFPTDELEEKILAYPYNRNQNLPNNTAINLEVSIARSITKLTLNVNRAKLQLPNLVFSPVSIAGVLALVLLGSIGQTFNEIVNFMGFNEGFNIKNDNIEVHRQLGRISSAVERNSGSNDVTLYKTAIFVQEDYPIRKEYQQAADYFYKSSIINLNFQSNPSLAQRYINNWVLNNTNGIIPTLLDDVPDPNTKAIVTSTLYFKGVNWKPFYTNGRKNKSDRMAMLMYNGGDFPYYKDNNLNIEILGLPYKGGNTMYVILPHESNADKLRQLENYLTPADIERLVSSTRSTEVVIAFPKMKVVNTLNLAQTMRNLGLKSLFDPRSSNLALLTPGFTTRFGGIFRPAPTTTSQPLSNWANQLIFTRFSDQSNCQRVYDFYTKTFRCNESRQRRATQLEFLDKLQNEYQRFSLNPQQANPGLYADEFVHKTLIDITEEGTEAAAVSGIGINRSGGKVTFKCDVPFLFFIYQNNTKMILFWGSITSPEPSVPTSDVNNSK
ncbi:hypothetical protein RI129_007979 [Pyrocoelia pectoralis]|uniref:Serpin domain-containing protein n=1 Tax=Pyrocoelia pectoralis TaxID=417401 RepID=A0AAN7VIL5_9COLE